MTSALRANPRVNWMQKNWLPLSTAILISVVLVIALREAPWPYDPMFYMDNALFFTGDRPSLALEHRSLRWGLLIPMGLLQMIFGYSEAAYYGIPIVAMGVLAGAAFLLARRFMGPWWAGGAAVLTAANPIILSRSSHPFPDTLATGLVTLGIAAIVWMQSEHRTANYWLAGLAGILFGLAYAVREVVAPVFLPVILIILLLLRIKARYWLLIMAGSLLVFIVELGLMSAWFEDPLARIRVLLYRDERTIEESSSSLEKIQRIDAFQGSLASSATAIFRKWGQIGLGIAPVAGLIGLLVSWYRARDAKVRRLWLGVSAWLVVGWIEFVFFGLWESSDGVPVLNLTQIRYWYLLVPPVAIGVVGLLHALSRWHIGQGLPGERLTTSLAVVSCAVLCLGMIVASWGGNRQVVAGADHMNEFRNWLATDDHGREVVAARHRSMRIAEMYDNSSAGAQLWNGRMARLHTASPPAALMISTEDPRAGALLLDGREYDTSAPPLAWDLQFVSSNGSLAVLAAEDLDASTDEPRGVRGPDFPVSLIDGQSSRWQPELQTGGPYRYRVSYTGPTPLARCVWQEGAERWRSALALSVGDGVVVDEVTNLDFYCPANQESRLLLAASQGDAETLVMEIAVVNDRIVDGSG